MSVNGNRAKLAIGNWNEVFPPGTLVEYQGRAVKTWSWAAIGAKGEPSVFLDQADGADVPDEPVPLSALTVPGWVQSSGRKNRRPGEVVNHDRGGIGNALETNP